LSPTTVGEMKTHPCVSKVHNGCQGSAATPAVATAKMTTAANEDLSIYVTIRPPHIYVHPPVQVTDIIAERMRHPVLRKLAVVLAVLLAGDCLAGGEDCPAALVRARTVARSQSYVTFDQTPGGGWRLLAEGKSCFAEAGELIDFYVAGKEGLGAGKRANLSFHAGQVYAFAGRADEALKRFRRAVVNPEAPAEFKWSEYVLATISFLEHDSEGLVRHRDAIADAPGSANQSNLRVIDLLIANFDRPYREALRRRP
jgi:hypothetical protein